MLRRYLLAFASALVLATLLGVSPIEAKPGCACCGASCACSSCTCDLSTQAAGCDCCGGSTCCSAR